ncbi:MAG: O-antigen ligase family protein [Armatimonadota bacterium]
MQDSRVRNAALLLTVALYPVGLAIPGMIALLIVVAWEVVSRRWRWVPTALDLPFGALALAVVGSTLASPWREHSLPAAVYFLLAVAIVIPTAAAYVKGRVDRVTALLLLWVGGGVAAAVWGLAQSWSSCFTVLPTAAMGPTSNPLGTTLASSLIVALGLLTGGTLKVRWWVIAAVTVIFAGLVAAMSRAAWLGTAAGVVVLAIVGTQGRARLAFALGCAVAGGLLTVALLSRACAGATGAEGGALPVERPISTKIRSMGSLEANRNRLQLWKTVPRMVADHPLLGTGFGTFTQAFHRYRPADASDRDPPTAHNIFLNFAAETGVVGVAAFVGLCAVGLLSMWRWLARSPPASAGRAAAMAVLAALVTFLTNQLFDGTVLTVHGGFGFLVLFAIGAAGERYLAPAAAGSPPATTAARKPRGTDGVPLRSQP